MVLRHCPFTKHRTTQLRIHENYYRSSDQPTNSDMILTLFTVLFIYFWFWLLADSATCHFS